MTVKKVAIIAAAGAVLLAGALTLSMTLITRNKIEVTATETSAQNETEQEEGGVKTLENMENMPLYFEDTEKLLLPLRNTMEALGGTVKWDTETKQTAISYRGRTLRVRSGERDAVLNGYAVTLPDEPNMINGCLYVDEEVISAYYTGEVRFNHETKQVTLEMKDGTEPVVAVKELTADEENGGYSVDVPVIVGLNDANYEKSLNDSLMQQMQDYITAFMAEENTADSLLQVQVTTGFCTKDFLSILWEGTRNGDRHGYGNGENRASDGIRAGEGNAFAEKSGRFFQKAFDSDSDYLCDCVCAWRMAADGTWAGIDVCSCTGSCGDSRSIKLYRDNRTCNRDTEDGKTECHHQKAACGGGTWLCFRYLFR